MVSHMVPRATSGLCPVSHSHMDQDFKPSHSQNLLSPGVIWGKYGRSVALRVIIDLFVKGLVFLAPKDTYSFTCVAAWILFKLTYFINCN